IEDTFFGPQPSGSYDSHGEAVTLGEETSLYEAQRNDARDLVTYSVMSRDYLIGDVDDYTSDGTGSVDDAAIDAAWESSIDASSPLAVEGFDHGGGAANVAFTIGHELDAGERVIHGSLALALKQNGGTIDSDYLRLFDFDPANQATFSDLGWADSIDSITSFVGVVDLGGELDRLQNGSVNVQISEDVEADWALYVVTVA
ncbi:unnamed protein product, partial [Ectocarpus sp. 4 AP-2014]